MSMSMTRPERMPAYHDLIGIPVGSGRDYVVSPARRIGAGSRSGS